MGKQLCLTFLRFELVTPMLSLATFAQEKPLRPNVVYIVSDDQGWKDGQTNLDLKKQIDVRCSACQSHLPRLFHRTEQDMDLSESAVVNHTQV